MTQTENTGLMAKIVNFAKVLCNRQLTPQDIQLAQDGHKEHDSLGSIEYRANQPGDFEVIQIDWHFGYSPDFSHGWKIPHYGTMIDKEIHCKYDWQGRLKEKYVWIASSGFFGDETLKTIQYTPPGRFIGKTVDNK